MKENTNCIKYDYKLNDLLLVYYKQYHNYEAPYKGTYKIIQTWTSVTVTLSMVSVHYSV